MNVLCMWMQRAQVLQSLLRTARAPSLLLDRLSTLTTPFLLSMWSPFSCCIVNVAVVSCLGAGQRLRACS